MNKLRLLSAENSERNNQESPCTGSEFSYQVFTHNKHLQALKRVAQRTADRQQQVLIEFTRGLHALSSLIGRRIANPGQRGA